MGDESWTSLSPTSAWGVHKDTIAIALAEAGKRGEVREHGKIANTPAALKTAVAKLVRSGSALRFCYG